jgi:hypothetical protein
MLCEACCICVSSCCGGLRFTVSGALCEAGERSADALVDCSCRVYKDSSHSTLPRGSTHSTTPQMTDPGRVSTGPADPMTALGLSQSSVSLMGFRPSQVPITPHPLAFTTAEAPRGESTASHTTQACAAACADSAANAWSNRVHVPSQYMYDQYTLLLLCARKYSHTSRPLPSGHIGIFTCGACYCRPRHRHPW